MHTRMRLISVLLVVVHVAFGAACPPPPTPPPPPPPPAIDPGALVAVTMSSRIGVLLDDFPAALRDRVADDVIARGDDFWIERARNQLRLTSVRLVYRKFYFDEAEQPFVSSLPLPPEEQWNIALAGAPVRTTVDGHDLVVVDYTLSSTLLTDVESPGISDPALAEVGGSVEEAFSFPIDPTLILQRTGFACISEDQFPADSVDAEGAYRFYDDTCEAEEPGFNSCHYTEPLPDESCIDALDRVVGRHDTAIVYERLAWNDAVADTVRFGELTTPDFPDLKVLTTGEGLNHNRVIYRYIPPGSCAVADGCVGAPGWRRLMLFDSHDHNVGGEPLHIGPVDYYVEGIGGELIEHNAYEYSACHDHFHFKYYGDFSWGDAAIQKNGFCIESTDRLSNNELSPLHTEYSCENQGVDPGWGDLYGASLTCNWVDITDVDTSAGAVTDDLTFRSNPNGFLCEGTLVVDENGEQVWEPTEFRSAENEVVDRPACDEVAGTEENDTGTIPVTVPARGGMVTTACQTDQDLGPLRNCGFALDDAPPFACTPGDPATLSCSGASAAQPTVVRLCETSAVLGDAVDCSHLEALANVVLGDDAAASIAFTCPQARDATEPGGEVALFTAPVIDGDGAAPVTCTLE